MIVADKIYIPSDRISGIANDIIKDYTYSNPQYHTLRRNGYSVKGVPATLYNFAFQDIAGVKHLVLPRGYLKDTIQQLSNHKISVRFKDNRIYLPNTVDITLSSDKTPSAAQSEVITLLKQHVGGLIQMGCGGGKTFLGVALACELKQPTLIIVHRAILQKQWLQEFKESCSGKFTLGRIDGSHKKWGDITIALIDSLASICDITSDTPDFSVLDRFGLVLIDECHLVPAKTFKTIVDNTKAHYRVGVTGTVKRKDQFEFLMHDTFGDILRDVKDSELHDRITDFTYNVTKTNIAIEAHTRRFFKRVKNTPQVNVDYTELIDSLLFNEERNTLILEKVRASISKGYKVLVLTSRVEHAKLLFDALNKTNKGYLLIGKANKVKIADVQVIQDDPDFQFVVANTGVAGVGMNIPPLSCLHLVVPTSNLPQLKQFVARIRRTFPGKPMPVVEDYEDNLVTCPTIAKDNTTGTMNIFSMTASKRVACYKKLHNEYMAGIYDE